MLRRPEAPTLEFIGNSITCSAVAILLKFRIVPINTTGSTTLYALNEAKALGISIS